ncbi:ribosomal protection-like ABC-F family protein [Clostridium sp. KNHs214]|uniref:ribosomal protection-like ABC-F family protein n=1 Tax=Clostridium sp. KNHs214 TaxID=1540257 RepID=UPI0005524E7F|nr:ABC-F family ATP-binding cassette domain-containing protein [Clostridium sp. KNHs214]
MIILSCKDIHKSYGIDVILNKVSFNISEGDKIGLIGVNGAGKSTLFKILTNDIEQDSGELFIDKSKKIGYLSQHLSLESSLNIYEEMLTVFSDLTDIESKLKELEIKMNEPYSEDNAHYHEKAIKDYTTLTEVYNHRGGYVYKGEINRVLTGLGFLESDFNKPINILSGGQKTRVALCKLLLVKPDILLLDEPTNHLDLDAIEWLEEYLRDYKGSVLIISHDRYFLDAVTHKTFQLVNGCMNMYTGNYSKSLDLRKKDYEVQLKAYNLQQQEIKRQEDIIKKYRSFNREKSIRAAESRQKALDKIDRLEKPTEDTKSARITFETAIKSGNDVLHIENLSKSFGEKHLFSNLNLDIKSGDVSALIGENGRGKTTLFKIVMDRLSPDSGIKVLGKNVFLGYYDQEQSDLNLYKTVIDEVWDTFPNLTQTEIRNYLAAFLFTGDDVFKEIHTLSGGEKCKINLLKLMLSKSNFLLLDEPTNHLDIMSREALEDAILNYDGTVLLISHDRYFLNKVVHKIYELKEDELKEYLGDYSYYIEKKKNPLRFEQEEENEGKTKTQIKLEKKKKREEKKLEKQKKLEIKKIEDDISNKETLLEELQKELCKEEIYSNPEKSENVNKEIIALQAEIDILYENWEELSNL